MAKKKSVVKRTKGAAGGILAVMMAAGWLMAAYTVLAHDEVREQNAMISLAKGYLEDKLYVRAASQYKEALAAYDTENNLRYESELLALYKEGGMMEEYYGLIQRRMGTGDAAMEEYLDMAKAYVEEGSINRAIPVLQQGMEVYRDQALENLYESVCYRYEASGTTFTQVNMPSSDWYIPAFDGEHWGYVGTGGKTILDFLYEEATCFSGNYAVVRVDGVYTLIDKSGYWNAVDKNGLDEVTAICGRRIVGVKDGQYAIYSNTFAQLSSETYDKAYLSDNGLVAVEKGGKWAILDENFQQVTDYRFTDVAANSKGQVFYGNYAVVADEGGYYLINGAGEAYFDARFAHAKGIEEGLFAVADSSGRWGFANEKAELAVDYQYEDAYSFSNRLAAVKYAGKWGYINKYGNAVIETQFRQAWPFLSGNCLVTDDLGNYKVLKLKYYSLF